MAGKGDLKGRDHFFALSVDSYQAVLAKEAIHHFASLQLAILYALWVRHFPPTNSCLMLSFPSGKGRTMSERFEEIC
jgi:hypothetical protein